MIILLWEQSLGSLQVGIAPIWTPLLQKDFPKNDTNYEGWNNDDLKNDNHNY